MFCLINHVKINMKYYNMFVSSTLMNDIPYKSKVKIGSSQTYCKYENYLIIHSPKSRCGYK